VKLNGREEPFEQVRIASGRYINFLSDFLSAEKDATRADALAAWKELKRMDVPKDYRAWKKVRS
jgi:hypothetical protein